MVAWLWVGFVGLILLLIAVDLGVVGRSAGAVSVRQSVGWTAVWVAAAMLFGVVIYFLYQHHVLGIGAAGGARQAVEGKEAAVQYVTGYVIEQTLSLDNIFVIALIFAYFGVERGQQHRVLFWGVVGAQAMRGAMIGAGAALLGRFDWFLYVFAGLLLYTAARMMLAGESQAVTPERNPLVKLARRIFPVSPGFEGERFFTRVNGRRAVTPLLLVLLVVESTDVLFAFDSIPAIFAVTREPYIVFTSNIFAILGLRSLYFALAGMLARFRHVKTSLVVVLVFVAVKMLVGKIFPIGDGVSLAVVAGVLGAGVVASVVGKRGGTPRERGG